MFRQLLRFRHNLAKFDNIATFNHRHVRITNQLLLSRHFSSEMTADWPQAIKDFLDREQISQPTAIQEKTLPIAMQNKDLVGVARTGSGKTLAFAIPAIMKILKERENEDPSARNNPNRLPTCLVLAPTRELAMQTSEVLDKFRNLGIKSIVLVGGSSRSAQMNELYRGAQDIYIATPGRLLDLMESNIVDLSNIKYLVLDEADRMLDMGFEPQIRSIIKGLPQSRQTLMWSATWPKEIQHLAQEFMQQYEYIAVDSEKLKANPNIKQIIHFCQPRDKLNMLLDHIRQFNEQHEKPRILIFSNQKRTVDGLLVQLMRNKLRAIGMHGDRSQRDRNESLRLFKNQLCNIMVATDVAARGLDINDITHVINYDFPNTIEDYIHRIGRTARHEKTGTSVTFFSDENASLARKLVAVLRETNQEVPDILEDLALNGTQQSSHYGSSMGGFNKRRPRNDFYSRGGGGLRRGYDDQSARRNQYRSRGGYDYGDEERVGNRNFQNRSNRRYSNVFEDEEGDDDFNDRYESRNRSDKSFKEYV